MFRLLQSLPPEVCGGKIFPFLSGKDLSTLVLALLSDKSTPEHRYLLNIVLKAGEDRLESIIQTWTARLTTTTTTTTADATTNKETDKSAAFRQKASEECRASILRAIHCIEQFQLSHQEIPRPEANDFAVKISRQVSETMILSDLFLGQQNAYSNTSSSTSNVKDAPTNKQHGFFQEWPVWCGKIQVLLWVARGPFHGFNRSMLEANVFILSPNFNPLNYLAWDSIARQEDNNDNNIEVDKVGLVAETYNFLPTAPIGRLVGVRKEDDEALQTIALRLGDQNTVAILSPQLQSATPSRYIQNIRVITRAQGRDRLRNMPSLPFASYVNGQGFLDSSEKDLLCDWQFNDTYQDAIVTTARDCVPFFLNILKNKEKCMAG